MKRLIPGLILGGMVFLLAGCGISGSLERPDPLWGKDAAQQSEDRRLEEERRREEARRGGRAPANTATSVEPSSNQPPRTATTP